MFDSLKTATRTFLALGREVPTAMKPAEALLSPDAQQESWRFQNFRARLAQVPEDRVRRVLTLLMARAIVAMRRGQPSLLRSLPDLAPTRTLSVWITRQAAGHDPDFQKLVAQGDQARDSRRWAQGVAAYDAALGLYRHHAGFRVQLSHCLKEFGRTIDAEIGYRDAIALGAPVDEVWPHLDFVAVRNGGPIRLFPSHVIDAMSAPLGDEGWRAALVTSFEVRALTWLLHGNESPSTSWLLQILRAAPILEETKRHLIADPAFVNANASLIALAGVGSRA